MILVREVFQIDPDHMQEAKELAGEMRKLEERLGLPPSRLYTDLAGEYYTLVMESEHPGLGDFERRLTEAFAHPEWRAHYPRFRRLLRGGRREIYSVIT
jgi:hypothetical protein